MIKKEILLYLNIVNGFSKSITILPLFIKKEYNFLRLTLTQERKEKFNLELIKKIRNVFFFHMSFIHNFYFYIYIIVIFFTYLNSIFITTS